MKASFRKHVGPSQQDQIDITIVHLTGAIDVESVDLFQRACKGPLAGRSVLFNFEGLSFVGSSGLRTFLECLNTMTNVEGSDVRFCGVRNDFRQILAATPLITRPCYETESNGIQSYLQFRSKTTNQDGDFSLEG